MIKMGRLEPVDLRELWAREYPDFSYWLQDNIEYLSEALDIRPNVVPSEKSAGAS